MSLKHRGKLGFPSFTARETGRPPYLHDREVTESLEKVGFQYKLNEVKGLVLGSVGHKDDRTMRQTSIPGRSDSLLLVFY